MDIKKYILKHLCDQSNCMALEFTNMFTFSNNPTNFFNFPITFLAFQEIKSHYLVSTILPHTEPPVYWNILFLQVQKSRYKPERECCSIELTGRDGNIIFPALVVLPIFSRITCPQNVVDGGLLNAFLTEVYSTELSTTNRPAKLLTSHLVFLVLSLPKLFQKSYTAWSPFLTF